MQAASKMHQPSPVKRGLYRCIYTHLRLDAVDYCSLVKQQITTGLTDRDESDWSDDSDAIPIKQLVNFRLLSPDFESQGKALGGGHGP